MKPILARSVIGSWLAVVGPGAGDSVSARNYRDLEVWQRAMDLVVSCYDVTRQFPKSEIYGLSSQLQRAAVSIPAKIAEG
jgi:hypothetical protein